MSLEEFGVATSGSVDRDDVCAECGADMYYRIRPGDWTWRIVASFCGDIRCPAAFKEIPE